MTLDDRIEIQECMIKGMSFKAIGKRIGKGRTTISTEENPTANHVETDAVIGRIGGKVIMTFRFVNVDFMFGLLLDSKAAAEASHKIRLF